MPSGTDRISRANEVIGAEYIVNVQADEPLVTGGQIRFLLGMLNKEGVAMSTLATRLTDPERVMDPNQVKVVCDRQGHALYFSRAPIPWVRERGGAPTSAADLADIPVLGHLGLYGYTADFLRAYVSLGPSDLERAERLEQLRAMENGYRIAVGLTHEPSIGVDTPADAIRFEQKLAALE